jgi:glycosidase
MPGASAAKLKLGFAILLTMRAMPQIYSGGEIAMTGGEDPDNRHDFPGGFPGDTHNAFTASGPERDARLGCRPAQVPQQPFCLCRG